MGIRQKLKLDWIWLKLSYSFRWAHHPTCDPYRSQRYELHLGDKTIHLCQGCTLVTIGSILSFLGIMLMILFTTILTTPVLLGIMLVPIIPVTYIDGKGLSRKYKRIARLLLGVGTGTSIATIIFYPSWWFKAVVIFSLIVAKYGYETLRSKSLSIDLCQTCTLLDKAPYCPGMIDKMEANKKYQEYALPVVNTSIKENVISKYESTLDSITEQVPDPENQSNNSQENNHIDVIYVNETDQT